MRSHANMFAFFLNVGRMNIIILDSEWKSGALFPPVKLNFALNHKIRAVSDTSLRIGPLLGHADRFHNIKLAREGHKKQNCERQLAPWLSAPSRSLAQAAAAAGPSSCWPVCIQSVQLTHAPLSGVGSS